MKKLFKALLITAFIFIVTWSYGIHERLYFYSPDKTKIITVYKPFYIWQNSYYLIPYKYTSLLLPMDNYCIYSPKNSLWIFVDWNPSDGKRLNIAPYDVSCNHLANDIRIGSEKEFDGHKDGIEEYPITGEFGYMSANNPFIFGLFLAMLLLIIAILSILLFILFMVRLIKQKKFRKK